MDTPAIREKYDQASALFESKNYAKAKQVLLEAWAQRKTADVATLLGQTEVKLGNHVDAAKYFAYAVANFPPTEPMKNNEVIRRWLSEEMKHVVTVDVAVKEEGATVSVDGVAVGVTPLQTPLFMEPGRHIVIVRKAGYRTVDRNVDLPAGSTDTWDVTLKEEELPAVAPVPKAVLLGPVRVQPPLGDPRFDESSMVASKPNPWILVAGGAVTLGGVVTGLVFNAKANRAEERADALRVKTNASDCYDETSNVTDCAGLLDQAKTADTSRNIAVGAFVVGGAAAIGTAVYWFWPRRKPLENRVQVMGFAAPSGTSLMVSGKF
ncbi:MAG TPA: PEGA domain-containing protein [Polyangiaceae bacterium]|nr:PEGA domain-containing protein [Polyangiaceae bacterium]